MSLKMIDMRKTSEEMAKDGMPYLAPRDEYPCGLTITFNNDTIEKLRLDHGDWEIGDVFDLRAMARVTGINENQTDQGDNCCITLQIVMMGCESEDAEDEEY